MITAITCKFAVKVPSLSLSFPCNIVMALASVLHQYRTDHDYTSLVILHCSRATDLVRAGRAACVVNSTLSSNCMPFLWLPWETEPKDDEPTWLGNERWRRTEVSLRNYYYNIEISANQTDIFGVGICQELIKISPIIMIILILSILCSGGGLLTWQKRETILPR